MNFGTPDTSSFIAKKQKLPALLSKKRWNPWIAYNFLLSFYFFFSLALSSQLLFCHLDDSWLRCFQFSVFCVTIPTTHTHTHSHLQSSMWVSVAYKFNGTGNRPLTIDTYEYNRKKRERGERQMESTHIEFTDPVLGYALHTQMSCVQVKRSPSLNSSLFLTSSSSSSSVYVFFPLALSHLQGVGQS